jgi:2-keto-4-pentenoate hydratase
LPARIRFAVIEKGVDAMCWKSLCRGSRLVALAGNLVFSSLVGAALTPASAEDCRALGRSVAEHWLARTPLPLIDTALTMEQAECARSEFLSRLQPLLGAPLGYKAAAITPPAQRDLGVHEPLGASYLAGMFRMLDGHDAVVPVNYGARPIVEAKLVVTVRDEGINDARTPAEVAQHIAYILPSIELGDSLVQPSQKLTGPILTLYNVGGRAMLNGPPVAFDATSGADSLRELVVTTRDGTGKVLEVERGKSIMGDPLQAVLWIIHDQNARGVRLKAGDRLGLGALSRVRPTAGLIFDTTWEGLQKEPVKLTVRFE